MNKVLFDPDDVKNAITSKTAVISVMHANNETGTIEPIEEIGKIAEDHDICFHTDAVQTVGHPTRRLPHILNICFESVEGEAVVLNLDRKGVAVSSGSACTSDFTGASHVLNAIGISPDMALGSIRFILGRSNTEKDIDYVVDSLKCIIKNQRAASPLLADKEQAVETQGVYLMEGEVAQPEQKKKRFWPFGHR